MKKIIFFIGLWLISCKSVKINGIFCESDTGVGYTCISLNDDIYKLEIVEGLYHGTSSGTWRKKNNKIILNSFIKNGIIRTREENWNLDNIIVKIIDTTGIPTYFKEVKIVFDNSKTQIYQTNSNNYDGQIFFNGNKGVKQIDIKMSEEEFYTSYIKNSNANYFEIVIQPKDDSYIYFKDKELKLINKHKIFYYRKINDKFYLKKLKKVNQSSK